MEDYYHPDNHDNEPVDNPFDDSPVTVPEPTKEEVDNILAKLNATDAYNDQMNALKVHDHLRNPGM